MIKGAIFDLDGTLLDSMHIWTNTAERYLERLGIKAEPGIGKAMFYMSMTEGAEYLRKRYNLEMATGEIIAGINSVIDDFYANEVQLKEGADRFLAGLKEAGIKIALATATDREVFMKAFDRLDLAKYFDGIFTTTEVGAGKTRPDIYLAAARHLGAEPGDTWVFEDALYAIRTAKTAGFRTVGVYDPSSREDWEEIKKIGDIHMDRLEDVGAFLKHASREY